jgi:putative copper export protein
LGNEKEKVVMITVITIVSEIMLYISISLLMGYFILQMIPLEKKPEMTFSRAFLLALIVGIPIFSFLPIVRLIVFLSNDVGFLNTLQSVLFHFEVGKAWLYTICLSIGIFLLNFFVHSEKSKMVAPISFFYLVGLMIVIGWSGHASSLDMGRGFLGHTIHFLVISVWTGILLQVAFFSKDRSNWGSFLKWFSPVAVGCLVVAILSGFMLMNVILPTKQQYFESWILPYGQALLIKHLLMIPLLLLALLNHWLLKNNHQQVEKMNIHVWLKAETLFIICIYIATGILGQQSPPHTISETILMEGPSALFSMFYNGEFGSDFQLQMDLQIYTFLFIFMALAFMLVMVLAFFRRGSSKAAVFFGFLSVFSWYLAIMQSIQFG